MKLFKSQLVAPATIGLLAPFSTFAGEADLNDISNYSNLEHIDLANAFVNDDYADNYTVYTTVSRIATKNDGRDGAGVLATEVFNSSSNADHAHLGSAHGDLA